MVRYARCRYLVKPSRVLLFLIFIGNAVQMHLLGGTDHLFVHQLTCLLLQQCASTYAMCMAIQYEDLLICSCLKRLVVKYQSLSVFVHH
jgi:hypothetical protein